MKNLIIIIALFSSINCFAQNSPSGIINTFFNKYENEGSNIALDYLFSTNKWMGDSKTQIDNIKLNLSGTLELIGNYYGYEEIILSSIGNDFKLYTFLVKYDRQPLRFSILLYKPNDTWRLQNFSYDDNLDEELDEAAKAYRLEENIAGMR
ncbi:hypothetical protein [Reichenbachiella sp. MALMAid0571]|uniref:hypothetical protein n=1 Tax=Reichenbachiella sp. MALMAid0571 TaxID=3143939 RepID=UPI0032DF305A